MKILIVSQHFWPENFRINDLAEELSNRGNEVTILTGLPNYPTGRFFKGYSFMSCGFEIKDKIKIIRVPVVPRFSSSKIQLAINYLSYVFSASILGPFICRDKYDVIFTYAPSPLTVGIPGVLLKWIKKAPMVIWVQDLWPEVFRAVEAPKSNIFFYAVEVLIKWIYKNSNLILVQSKGFIALTSKLAEDDTKIEYFPNWAESLYKPIENKILIKDLEKIPANEFIVMFAGNIGSAQSIETIAEAAEKLKSHPIHWVILGDGRKKDWLENEIEKRSLKNYFHILGRKPMELMPDYFSNADVLLATLRSHPVMRAWIPGKVQSYLACGKPIIGALDGSGAEVIEESKCGYAVRAGDSEGLAKSILAMSQNNKKEREKMGLNAIRYYKENFDRDTLITRLEGYFKEI
tara:strand:- start:814 stop:2028 length:1215 start_codon:yes stop_codon:yes gene_type:complete